MPLSTIFSGGRRKRKRKRKRKRTLKRKVVAENLKQ